MNFFEILKDLANFPKDQIVFKRKDWALWIELNNLKKSLIHKNFNTYFVISEFPNYLRILTVNDILADDWEIKRLMNFTEKYPKGIFCKILLNNKNDYIIIKDKINKSGQIYYLGEDEKIYPDFYIKPFYPLVVSF